MANRVPPGIRLNYDAPRGVEPVGLGDATAPSSPVLGTGWYTLAALTGAALGGAAVGYVASKDRGGAIRGASLLAGLAMISDAGVYVSSGRAGAAAFSGVLGLTGVGYALHSFSKLR